MNETTTNNSLETNKLSPYVRPVAALSGFLFYNIFIALLIVMMIQRVEVDWQIIALLLSPDIIGALWYFNIRNGDKMFEKFLTMSGKYGGAYGLVGSAPGGGGGGTTPSPLTDTAKKVTGAAADTWGGQGGWDAQKAAEDARRAAMPVIPEVSNFNCEDFDAAVKKTVAKNPVWNDGSAYGLYAAATIQFNVKPYGLNKPTQLDVVKAMVDYTEAWFKELYFGDRNFNCVDANGNTVSPIEYVRLHLQDANACCPTCGKDIQACRPKTVEQLVDYAGDNYRFAYNQLTYFYEQRSILEAELA